MRVLEQVQQIPQPVHWGVIGGLPIVAWLEVVNPILQTISFLVAIVWGAVQIYSWWKKGK